MSAKAATWVGAGVLLCAALSFGVSQWADIRSWVALLDRNISSVDVHVDVVLDLKSRPLRVTPYYTDLRGNRVIHGDLIQYDWEGDVKTVEHFRNGESGDISSRAIRSDGTDIWDSKKPSSP